MITDRKKFDYKGKTLIEKVKIALPYRHEAIFQDEGCFLYIDGTHSKFGAADQMEAINSGESVLLKCGSYFVDWIQNAKSKTVDVYAIHLYPDVLRQLYASDLPPKINGSKIQSNIKTIASSELIDRFIHGLDFYFDNPAVVTEDLLALKIKELILLLIQSRHVESINALMSALFTPARVSIQEVIQTHLYSNLTVDKLAEFSGMSVSAFKRKFQEVYGCSPLEYFTRQKLKRAKELLALGKMNVTEVGYQVGYSDPAYFSRVFKKRFGYPPKAAKLV